MYRSRTLFTSDSFVLIRVVIVITCLLSFVDANVVTVYRAQLPLPTDGSDRTTDIAGTTIYSAIGPGESGMTKYEVQDVRSRFVIHNEGITATIIGEPTTVLTYTIEQGASSAKEDYPPLVVWPTAAPGLYQEPGLNADCTFDKEKKNAVCVGEQLMPQLQRTPGPTVVPSPKATTYTVDLVPVATITTSSAERRVANGAIFTTVAGVLVLGILFS